jgi:hypothetical protein
MYKKVAIDCMIIASEHIYDESEKQGGDGGYAMFMMEENCEQYDDMRMIYLGKSEFSEYRQKYIIKQFMDTYHITKEDIIKYREEKETYE